MIVEVTGTHTRNKGAELMLVAIREHFADRPEVQLAVDQFFGAYIERAKYRLLQKVELSGWGRSRIAMTLMPLEFRRSFGLVRDDDVDVLLDASGFAFGDQHPPERSIQFAEDVEAAKRSGKKVVLLPQALGPFEVSAIRNAFVRIVDAADLVYARDEMSLEYAREAAGNPAHLRQAPDFTNLVAPELSSNSDVSDLACIVPNRRMIEKVKTTEEADAYVPFMERCVEAVEAAGLTPVLLLHQEEDDKLASDIQDHVGRTIPVHQKDDPVTLKQFLGESHLIVGSRFHALVAALSQGVPAIGTSWSHKYEMLFEEYECSEMLLSVAAEEKKIKAGVSAATGERRTELTDRIRTAGVQLEKETASMWREVDDLIFGHKKPSGMGKGGGKEEAGTKLAP
jgi:colanic acid/amylovoran biosynthesis protein